MGLKGIRYCNEDCGVGMHEESKEEIYSELWIVYDWDRSVQEAVSGQTASWMKAKARLSSLQGYT